MLGYLSALNMHKNRGKDALKNVDALLVRDWAINFCKTHRDQGLAEASQALFERLSK
jgi:hypothetical protein